MKIMIEVNGGVVQNIVATEEISIHVVDHDDLSDNDFDSCYPRQAQQPDLICDEEQFEEELSEALKSYEVEEV